MSVYKRLRVRTNSQQTSNSQSNLRILTKKPLSAVKVYFLNPFWISWYDHLQLLEYGGWETLYDKKMFLIKAVRK